MKLTAFVVLCFLLETTAAIWWPEGLHLFSQTKGHQLRLYRRSTSGGFTTVSPSDLNKAEVSTAGSTARQSQLNYLGSLASSKNVSAWIDYGNNLKDTYLTTPNAQQIIFQSPFAPLFRIVIFGFIMAILVPLISFCICCLRCCCDTCGGRKPSPEGYEMEEILGHIVIYAVLGIIVVSMAALLAAYGGQLASVIPLARTGTDAVFGASTTFLENTKAGVSASSDAAIKTAVTEVNTLLNITIPSILNQTFDMVVLAIRDDLYQLQADVDLVRGLLVGISVYLSNIVNRTNEISGVQISIRTQLNNLTNFTIPNPSVPGYSLQLPANNFSVSNLPSENVQNINSIQNADLSQAPNITGYLNSLSNVPNLRATGDSAYHTYTILVSNLSAQINGSLGDFATNPKAQLNNQLGSVNNSISSIQDSVNNGQTSAYQYLDKGTLIATYMYGSPPSEELEVHAMFRRAAYLTQGLLVIFSILISFVGIFLKKGAFLNCFCVAFTLLSILFWIQFSFFYLVSAPLNIVCNSIGTILNTEYSVPSSAILSNFTVSPQAFVDGCQSDLTVFTAPINHDGVSLSSFLLSHTSLILNTTGLDNAIDADSIKKSIDLSSFENNTAQLQSTDLSSFNTSALNIPDPSIPVNLTLVSSDLLNTTNNFTPASFDSDLGNVTQRDVVIAQFNQFVVTEGNPNPNLDYSTIVQDFIVNGQIMTPSNYSSNGNSIVLSFYTSNGPFMRSYFIYSCNAQIAVLQNKAQRLSDTILGLQAKQINPILGNLSLIRSNVNNIGDAIQNLTVDINGTLEDVAQISLEKDKFVDLAVKSAIHLVNETFVMLITNVLIENPDSGFGKCKDMANSIVYNEDLICQTFLNALEGIWFCCMMVCLFGIAQCLVGCRAVKRIDYWRLKDTGGLESKGKSKMVDSYMEDDHAGPVQTAKMSFGHREDTISHKMSMPDQPPSYSGDAGDILMVEKAQPNGVPDDDLLTSIPVADPEGQQIRDLDQYVSQMEEKSAHGFPSVPPPHENDD